MCEKGVRKKKNHWASWQCLYSALSCRVAAKGLTYNRSVSVSASLSPSFSPSHISQLHFILPITFSSLMRSIIIYLPFNRLLQGIPMKTATIAAIKVILLLLLLMRFCYFCCLLAIACWFFCFRHSASAAACQGCRLFCCTHANMHATDCCHAQKAHTIHWGQWRSAVVACENTL